MATREKRIRIQSSATTDDTKVVRLLKDNYAHGFFHTRLSYSLLVSLNPIKNAYNLMPLMEDYISPAEKELPPHIFELAGNAYYNMKRLKNNQTIVFMGETGSGRTEAMKQAIQMLISVSSKGHKERKLFKQISASQIVLEAFGNAVVTSNDNSSRFGQYTEMQFNSKVIVNGMKTLDYFLEKRRVSTVPDNERNFHIFYYLLAGLSREEKLRLELKDPSHFHYLKSFKSTKIRSAKDEKCYEELSEALKSIGMKEKSQRQIFELIAAILHLGNLQFDNGEDSQCVVKNKELLATVAEMLGVRSKHLETALTLRTNSVGGQLCSTFLSIEESQAQRDDLAEALYSLLFEWIVESINQKLAKNYDPDNVIGLVNMRDIQNGQTNSLEELNINFVNEKLYNFIVDSLFVNPLDLYRKEQLNVAAVQFNDNLATIDLFLDPKSGIYPLLEGTKSDESLVENISSAHSNSELLAMKSECSLFSVKHYKDTIVYDAKDMLIRNNSELDPDFVMLFKGGSDVAPTFNKFIADLFEITLSIKSHPKDKKTILHAQQQSRPLRQPSLRRKEAPKREILTVSSQILNSVGELFDSFEDSKCWFVVCIAPSNDLYVDFDVPKVRDQVKLYNLEAVATVGRHELPCSFTFADFNDRYKLIIDPLRLDAKRGPRERCEAVAGVYDWKSEEFFLGKSRVFLNEYAWKTLESELLTKETELNNYRSSMYPSENTSVVEYADDNNSDNQSTVYSRLDLASSRPPLEKGDRKIVLREMLGEGGIIHENEHMEEFEISKRRKRWTCLTWSLTWWIPSFVMGCCGIRRPDMRMAWREKVALCMLIFLLCGSFLTCIVGLGAWLCPRAKVYSIRELSWRQRLEDPAMTYAYGMVFDISSFANYHNSLVGQTLLRPDQFAEFVGGKDAKPLFQFPLSDCIDETDPDYEAKIGMLRPIRLKQNAANPLNSFPPHKFPNNALDLVLKDYKAGDVVFDMNYIRGETLNGYTYYITYKNEVFDVSEIVTTEPEILKNEALNFILPSLGVELRKFPERIDYTEIVDKLPAADRQSSLYCLRRLFKAGKMDQRKSWQCLFADYLLLALSVILALIILFKFLAALQLSTRRQPEDYDRFVVCQIPCYTEGEESLKKTINSVAVVDYDDKHKLLFIIADGMIVGSGNDRPTPRIVLDILGVDPSLDPEAVPYKALGEGSKQLNMAKVYSGLYEIDGHVVPYVVVVKVGKPSETARPGNRGKRDSQMILMNFLNRAFYETPMNPLELEIYHQMKNVIGAHPAFYEFLFMIDADTQVMRDSLNRLVAVLTHDTRVMGVCGETRLSNSKKTWVTMIQVYEYYISHFLSKAFESLFGTVTCLPGCFCIYRIRTADRSKTLLVSNDVTYDYSENNVDTLHKKNLLSLGEDRYLTTLMLKHFPNYKTVFTADAKAETSAPEGWSVLISQRRRWINSTVHNLLELMMLPGLCGFCLFSMRFVVFIDLFATLVQPATIVYLVYLVVLSAAFSDAVPLLSLIMLAVVYGLQAIIFILKRRWEHVAWMIIYIIALPVFGFFLPLYAFWHFDDFSWGNTRVVVGDNKKKVFVADNEKFHESDIPLKTWKEYEAETFEEGSVYGDSKPGSVAGSLSEFVPRQSYISHASLGYNLYGPSDEEFYAEIRRILAGSDLMTITKKQVRMELSQIFQMDLSHKRDLINSFIDDIVQTQ